MPHIAVHSSKDTVDLVGDKGFEGGLWALLRPFGERVQGKVTVRDSTGAGKTWDDFAVRFVQLGDGLEVPTALRKSQEGKGGTANGQKPIPVAVAAKRARSGGDISQVETLVNRHLTYAEEYPSTGEDDYLTCREGKTKDSGIPSPFYTLFLRRLLSGLPLAPHETFAHPVACIIAISSRNTNPIEELRKLYAESSQQLPMWVNNEYLRYYVLVHDEERDDITKSIALFEQMKRHFGLHCHLLRLRSSQCISSDDDSVHLPRCEWLAAAEELSEIQARELHEDMDDSHPCIYESDTTAIKTFIRELVTQSVIPSMERNISTWNDQVASRRRGVSGRLLNITKKWTVGFGGTRNGSNGSPTGSSSNYDSLQGFYRPDAPEAIMRKLADYAFMLRDWKLAYSTYNLLISDFSNDKAWRYHAATNEMAAISILLSQQDISSTKRKESVDNVLEAACYSYITRCSTTYGALRALALTMELLRLRGGSATDDAARWGVKLLEYRVVGVIGEALIKERIAVYYASKIGSGSRAWGSRARKSALWSILAADAWLTLGKPQQAKLRLDEAGDKYGELLVKGGLEKWSEASPFLAGLRREVVQALYPESAIEGSLMPSEEMETEVMVEESQAFESRPHRRSLMGVQAPVLTGLESSPLLRMDEAEVLEENVKIQFE